MNQMCMLSTSRATRITAMLNTTPRMESIQKDVDLTKYFKGNLDDCNPKYNTKDGVYSEGYRLNNIMISWGHDDYMYMMFPRRTRPHCRLQDCLSSSTIHLTMIKYDLYSKRKVRDDMEQVKPY